MSSPRAVVPVLGRVHVGGSHASWLKIPSSCHRKLLCRAVLHEAPPAAPITLRLLLPGPLLESAVEAAHVPAAACRVQSIQILPVVSLSFACCLELHAFLYSS
jgi:hypothetical protein